MSSYIELNAYAVAVTHTSGTEVYLFGDHDEAREFATAYRFRAADVVTDILSVEGPTRVHNCGKGDLCPGFRNIRFTAQH